MRRQIMDFIRNLRAEKNVSRLPPLRPPSLAKPRPVR
jgi:hypothetical protein